MALNAKMLIVAYCQGAFPMADPDTGEIQWYQPNPRAVLPMLDIHVSHSLRKAINKQKFEIVADRNFEQVVRYCAEPRGDDEPDTWINEDIIQVYTELYNMGYAHSVEAYYNNQLVGGIYGMSINAAFFGESMFTKVELGGTNASKICLVALVDHLLKQNFSLFDTQFRNPHIDQFGVMNIPRSFYMIQLQSALEKNSVCWGNFSFNPHDYLF